MATPLMDTSKGLYEGVSKGHKSRNMGGSGYEQGTSKWYNPFSWGGKRRGWSPDEGAFMPYGSSKAGAQGMGLPDYWQDKAGYGRQIANRRVAMVGQDVRAKGMGMLDQLGRYASGQDSAARQQAQLSMQQGQNALASQAASSMRGGYDPAAQRAAMMATAQMGQNVAGSSAVAAAKERMAAQQAYLQQAAGIRSQDLAGRGQDIRSQLGFQQLGQQYEQQMTAYGLQDKYKELASRMALEQMRMQAYMGEKKEGAIGSGLGGAIGAIGGMFVGGPAGAAAGAAAGSQIGGGLSY